METMTLAGEQ